MYLSTVRPLAVVAAGAALALLTACGGGSTPAATGPTSASTSASGGSPTATGAATRAAGAPGATSGSGGGSGGSGQAGKGAPPETRPTGPVGNAAVKACSLVSAADSAAALHSTATMVTKVNSGVECEYESAAGDSVDLEVQAVPFTPDLPNAMTEVLPAGQVKRISGLGDAAVLFTPSPTLAQFYLWKSGLYVVIIVSRGGFGSASAAATTLGQTVAGRI